MTYSLPNPSPDVRAITQERTSPSRALGPGRPVALDRSVGGVPAIGSTTVSTPSDARTGGYISWMRLVSWNVNGIRAVGNKGLFSPFVDELEPDVICLQETKAQQSQSVIELPAYEEHWNSAEKKGYSGTAIF